MGHGFNGHAMKGHINVKRPVRGCSSRGCWGVEPQAGLEADEAPVTSLSRRSNPSSERGVLTCRSMRIRSSPTGMQMSLVRVARALAPLPPPSAHTACCSCEGCFDLHRQSGEVLDQRTSNEPPDCRPSVHALRNIFGSPASCDGAPLRSGGGAAKVIISSGDFGGCDGSSCGRASASSVNNPLS